MLTATPGLRHKECYADDLELAPVRLIGGFICVDTHVGCVGCPWCLNRRYPVQGRVLDAKFHRDFADVGVSVERIVSWIRALPSYRQARVPVRIGHVTDLAYEEEGACAILEALDPRYPVVLMSRFPIGVRTRRLLQAHRNALLHLTVTPSLDGPEARAARRALDSLGGLPAAQVFVVFCPLLAGVAPAVRELLECLPAGMSVGFKEIDVTAIPGCAAFDPMPRIGIDRLISEARPLGHRWLPFFGCQVRTNLGLPCFYFPKARACAPETCASCSNLEVCAQSLAPDIAEVRSCAAALGLRPTALRFLSGSIVEADLREAAARADETFLSEKLRVEVRLSSVARTPRRQTVLLSEDVFRRWQRVGFYPVDELRSAGGRMAALVAPRRAPPPV